jgi:polygalacturonase
MGASQRLKMLSHVALLITLALCAFGQDAREVREPSIPPSCSVLTPPSGALDENRPDTARIQEALDKCAGGHAVELKSGTYLSGPLSLRRGVTLLVGSGVVLLASRNPRDYDLKPGSCGIVNKEGHGCKALIGADHVSGAGVMGDGVIDGRGGATLTGQNVSWWGLAQEAKVKNENQNCPRLMQINNSDDFTLYRITLKNSPNFHVSYSGGNGFTAWGVIIDSPKTSRNTDGIDPSSATNVTITNSFIRVGDDNVAIKAGSTGPSSHITVSHNQFYSGHGMSIGSETDGGASAIRVNDLSIDGADNGIRIKSNSSRGGLVRDIVYSDVCIRDTKDPIVMDTHYSSRGTATKLPEFREITLENVRIVSPGAIILDGIDANHPLELTFNGLTLYQPSAMKLTAHHTNIRIGPAGSDLGPSGIVAGTQYKNTCEGKFVPFPGR